MLQLDPTERMTVPEIFNHVWVRAASSNLWIDSHLHHQSLSNNTSSSTNQRDQDANHIDFFSPFTVPQRVRQTIILCLLYLLSNDSLSFFNRQSEEIPILQIYPVSLQNTN